MLQVRPCPMRCWLQHLGLYLSLQGQPACPLLKAALHAQLTPRLAFPCTHTQGDDDEIAKLTERMKSLLGPFVLRRLKQEVAGQLTEKTHATGAPGRGGRVMGCCLHSVPLRHLQLLLLPAYPPGWLLVAGAPAQPSPFLLCLPACSLPPSALHLPAPEFIEMTEEQSGLYAASVARMRSQITGKAYAAAQDNSQKGVEKFLRALGAKKISHMFTHLRKIAQHPLLVRSQFTDDQVAMLARMAYERWVGQWLGFAGGLGAVLTRDVLQWWEAV